MTYDDAKTLALCLLALPQCYRCGGMIGVKHELAHTLYDHDAGVDLCRVCAEEYHQYWDDLIGRS